MLIGIVGKTNVGKSTFFKAATLAEVEIFNRPFVTIKPNHGCGFVKVRCVETEFSTKCKPRLGYCMEGWRFVPIDLLDVAGLVPGAHKGEGLGLQFLDDLRQADAFIHVIDISGSTNEKGETVPKGSYDPANDIKFLEHELDMWFLGLIKKNWEKFARTTQQQKAKLTDALIKQFSGLKITEEMIKGALKQLSLEKPLVDWTEADLMHFATILRKTSKKMIIAANKIDIPGSEKNLDKLKQQFPEYPIIGCSAESELALREAARKNLISYIPGEDHFEILKKENLNEKQQKALEFIKTNILDKFKSTGIQEVLNKAVFELLDHIAVFPVANRDLTDQSGNILPDCLLVPSTTNPLQFAYRIHTDIGDKFIKAINLKIKLPVAKEANLNHLDVIEIMTK